MSFWKSALTGLAGGLGPGLFSLGSSLLTNKGALSRQRLADQQNIKFWEMQNAYNTPAQQMARLKKAGLNPALIYGSGSANTGIAGAVAPSKPAPYNIKNPVPLQAMLLEAQIGNINANTENKNADTAIKLGIKGPKIEQATEQAAQEALRTLELRESYKKRIAILGEKVLQEKSITNLKNFDSYLADQGTRVNDFIGWRKLAQVWGFFTGQTDITPWLEKHIPSDKKIQEAFQNWKNSKKQ